MDLVAHPSKPLGPSEIARDWSARGHAVSRQYVDKLIRKGVRGERLEGEHVSTLEKAWLWRTARTGIFNRPEGGARETTTPPVVPSIAPLVTDAMTGGDSLEGELHRVKSLVFEAAQVWQRAARAIPYDSFAASRARKEYQEAVNTRIEVEGLIADYQKNLGILVSLVDAQQLLDERLSPLRAALQGLDKELAREFFPEDPAKYRPRFRSVITRALIASRSVAMAKRRLLVAAPNVDNRAA